MGNIFSSNEPKDDLKPKNISQMVDYIATYYILTMNFESLSKLNEKAYCDNLVVLTSDIIERYFTSLDVTYLAQRIKNGEEVNEMEKDTIVFFGKDELNDMDIGNDTIKKKRVCIGIAKYYIKISHLFAAIVMTVNPVYMYKDENGNNVRASLYDKQKIPPKTDRTIYKLNICDERIKSLQNKWNPNLKNAHPTMCDINVNKKTDQVKNLEDEPGIPELMNLYLDDKYDYKTGKFEGMSSKTEKIYRSNLEKFYTAFTNNDSLPDNITKFSDIKLRDYHSNPKCQGENAPYRQNYENDGSSLFTDYAENMRQMVYKVNKSHDALMNILNKIFVYTRNPITQKRQIRISPALTEEKLDYYIAETRSIIIKLYLTCEKDYTKGLNIYEAIVETRILNTTTNQLNQLKQEKEKMNSLVKLEEEEKEIDSEYKKNMEKEQQEIAKIQENMKKEQQENENYKKNEVPNPSQDVVEPSPEVVVPSPEVVPSPDVSKSDVVVDQSIVVPSQEVLVPKSDVVVDQSIVVPSQEVLVPNPVIVPQTVVPQTVVPQTVVPKQEVEKQ